MRTELVFGKIVTGLGKGAQFTQLDWARKAFEKNLGIDPFPGTLNALITDEISKEKWSFISHLPGILLQPHRPEWCDARCFLSTIEDRIDAAIILPEVKSYPADQIELISALPIRETLGLGDGQVISIKVFLE